MKILMLCGVFAKENEQEVIDHARAAVEFSANVFQQKLITGFRTLEHDFTVISAPFLGAWPNASDILSFRGFSRQQSDFTYVQFNNVWGLRNFSRASSLKKAVRPFIEAEDPEKLILVYCTHTPFLEAAVYAKKQDPRIRICLYVPDLPNYMNLSANRSRFYDVAKSYDIAVMTKLMRDVDTFVLLTEQMKEALPVGNKPYRVIEGIMSECPVPVCAQAWEPACEEKNVVYTGKLDEKFGIKNLIDAFARIPDPTFRLILCGKGDCDAYAAKAHDADSRIIPLGQVSPDEAGNWQRKAAVLINPRPNNEEYTKYSFPSKNVEYLLTGKPVAAYMLDGMPRHYRDFIYEIKADRPAAQAIAAAIEEAVHCGADVTSQKHARFLRYAGETLTAAGIARSVIQMNFQ